MKNFSIAIVFLSLIFVFSVEAMAQDFSVQGNASYWAGRFWVGASASAHLTDNLTARASLGISMNRYIRASLDGVYNFRLTDQFNPFLGAGVSYSTFVGPSLDLLGGVNLWAEGFRFNAEATYSIFFGGIDPRPNPFGFRVGMNFSL